MYDVVIIGGGPAGSTAGTQLARAGKKVLIIEKEKFPRPHVGESLLPYNNEIFKTLGVYDQMIKNFVRKPGVRFVSSDGTTSKTYCFKNVLKGQEYRTFNVNRAQFDHILLKNAVEKGAELREESRVLKVEHLDTDQPVSISFKDADGEKHEIQSKFLIDASGQDSFVGRTMGWKKPVPGLDRSAFATHWKGAQWTDEMKQGMIQVFYTGGEKKGWLWLVPLSSERVGIGVVLDNNYINQERKKLVEQGVKNWQEALYHQEIKATPELHHIMAAEGETLMPLNIVTNYSFTVDRKYGSNFALTGDAGAFLDPIFATGIYLGARTSMLVAESINQHLDNPDRSALRESFKSQFEVIGGAYNLVHKFIEIFYDPEGFNLANYSAYQSREAAFSLMHYLLAGDFFDKSETYLNFLNMLSDPKQMAKYEVLAGVSRSDHDNSYCLTEGAEAEVFAKN